MKKYLKMILATLILVIGIVSVNISASADELIGNPVFSDMSLTLSNGTYTGKVTVYNDIAENVGNIYIAIYNSEYGNLEQISITPITSIAGAQTVNCTLTPEKAGVYTAKMFVWGNKLNPESVITYQTLVVNGNFAVVTDKSKTKDDDGNDAYSLTIIKDGLADEHTVIATQETVFDDGYITAYNGKMPLELVEEMSIGSIFNYVADESGKVISISPVANVSNNIYVPAEDIDLSTNISYGGASYMTGITNERFYANEIITTAGFIELESFTNKYRFDNSNPNNLNVVAGNYRGGNVLNAADGMGNAVLARIVDGEVTDVITIDTRVPNE